MDDGTDGQGRAPSEDGQPAPIGTQRQRFRRARMPAKPIAHGPSSLGIEDPHIDATSRANDPFAVVGYMDVIKWKLKALLVFHAEDLLMAKLIQVMPFPPALAWGAFLQEVNCRPQVVSP